jgi:taurine dioxygenase
MSTDQLTITPLSEHLGVRLGGFEFESAADDPAFTRLMRQLLDEHLVVFAAKQQIQPNTLERFVANFGPLLDIKRAGNVAHHLPGAPWIKVISNGMAPDGIPYGDGNSSAQIWHSDSTPWEAPVGHIAFYCRQTVEPPPKTYFKNMIKVYEALSGDLKDRIAKLRVVHHFYPRQIEVKIHAEGAALPLEMRMAGFAHPLVRRHVGNNKPFLFLPTRRDSIVQGWSEEDSRALLTELWDRTNTVDFDFGVALMPDDFVIWDNRATVHSRDGWPEEQTRIMWHVSSEGEIPTPLHTKRGINTIGLTPDQAQAATANIYNDY